MNETLTSKTKIQYSSLRAISNSNIIRNIKIFKKNYLNFLIETLAKTEIEIIARIKTKQLLGIKSFD